MDLSVLEHGVSIDNVACHGVVLKVDRLSVANC